MSDPLDTILSPTLNDITRAPTVSDALREASSVQDVLDQTILKGTVANMQRQSETIQNLTDTTAKTAKEIEAEHKTLRDAQLRKADLARFPPFIQNIVGLFDPEFNNATWNARIKAAAANIEGKTFELQTMGDLANLQNQMFAKQIDMAKIQYTTLTDRVNRTIDIRKQMETEHQYGQQYALQLAQEKRSQAAEARTSTLFQQQQLNYQLSALGEDELAAARAGGNPNIPKQFATEEFVRREKQKLDLHSIQVASEAGDMQLADMKKNLWLRNLAAANPQELKAYQDQATKGGGHITIGSVDFTSREIAKAQADYVVEEKKMSEVLASELDAQTLTGFNVDESVRQGANASTALASPGIFADFQALHDKYVQQINNHIKVGDTQGAFKLSETLSTETDKRVEDIVKAFPAAQQPLVRSRVKDIPPSATDAMNFLGVSALNQNALNRGGGRFSGIYTLFATDVQQQMKDAGASFSLDDNGNPVFTTPNIKFDQIVQKSLSTGNYAERFQKMRNVQATDMALQLLAKANPAFANIRPDMFVQKFADPTTGVETQGLDDNAMLRYLRDRYDADVKSGVIPPSTPAQPRRIAPYDEQLLQFMESRPFQQQLYDYWTQGQTLNEYAFFETITGGNPLENYSPAISNMRRSFSDYYAKVLAAQAQAAATLSGIHAVGKGMGMGVPQ